MKQKIKGMIWAVMFCLLFSVRAEAFELIAHRGYSSLAPENTMASVRLAADRGYRYIECDIQFTKDNIPVLMHDDTVNRTAGKKGKTRSYTLKQMKKLDVGSWKNAEYAGEQVPALREVLKFCKKRKLHLYLELKNGSGLTPGRVKKLYRMVEKSNMKKQVTWISFNEKYLTWVKKLDHSARLGFIPREEYDASMIEKAKKCKTKKNQVFLLVKADKISPELLQQCKDKQIYLIARAVKNRDKLALLDPYYSGAITDGF